MRILRLGPFVVLLAALSLWLPAAAMNDGTGTGLLNADQGTTSPSSSPPSSPLPGEDTSTAGSMSPSPPPSANSAPLPGEDTSTGGSTAGTTEDTSHGSKDGGKIIPGGNGTSNGESNTSDVDQKADVSVSVKDAIEDNRTVTQVTNPPKSSPSPSPSDNGGGGNGGGCPPGGNGGGGNGGGGNGGGGNGGGGNGGGGNGGGGNGGDCPSEPNNPVTPPVNQTKAETTLPQVMPMTGVTTDSGQLALIGIALLGVALALWGAGLRRRSAIVAPNHERRPGEDHSRWWPD